MRSYDQIIKEYPEYVFIDLDGLFERHTALAELVQAANCETCFESDVEGIYTDEALTEIFDDLDDIPWEGVYVAAIGYLASEEPEEFDFPPNFNPSNN